MDAVEEVWNWVEGGPRVDFTVGEESVDGSLGNLHTDFMPTLHPNMSKTISSLWQ